MMNSSVDISTADGMVSFQTRCMAPMAAFFVLMQRYIIGGVTAGAVKG